MQINGTQHT
jgi:hypothetical protein